MDVEASWCPVDDKQRFRYSLVFPLSNSYLLIRTEWAEGSSVTRYQILKDSL